MFSWTASAVVDNNDILAHIDARRGAVHHITAIGRTILIR
jgi:hypothetical protein